MVDGPASAARFNGLVALALLVHETAHRVVGLYLGQQVTLAFWAPGLIAGVVLAMFSNGEIVFLVSGAITVKMMEVARLGKFRYGLSYNDLGVIAAAGPVANVGLAVVLRLLEFLPGGGLLHQAMMVNLVFALCNMLPIPPLDGAQFLFASRSWYVFTFAGIAAMTALLLLTNALLAVLGALLIGFLVFLVFFVMVETK